MQLNRSDCRGIQEVLGGKRAVAFDKFCQLYRIGLTRSVKLKGIWSAGVERKSRLSLQIGLDPDEMGRARLNIKTQFIGRK